VAHSPSSRRILDAVTRFSAILRSDELPFPAGEGPFCVKGIFHRGNIEYIERVVPGGLQAVLAAVRDPALRAFMEQPFVASSWYDIFPLVASSYPCAELCHKTLDSYLRQRAQYQAEQQGAGVYRSLLALTSPAVVAVKLPLLAAQLYKFGTTEAREIGPREVEIVRGEMPAALLPWYIPGTESYVLTALRMRGAKNPRAKTSSFRYQGKQHGLVIGSVRHVVSWD
jgi:hypothetical protein